MRDEDLYKFLLELKRPSSIMKKLKNITGGLKLEISPCPEDVKNGLTPELAKLHPYTGKFFHPYLLTTSMVKASLDWKLTNPVYSISDASKPCKEVLPFPLLPLMVPHYQYRNLLYIYPKDLNFTAFASRTGSARNIAVSYINLYSHFVLHNMNVMCVLNFVNELCLIIFFLL